MKACSRGMAEENDVIASSSEFIKGSVLYWVCFFNVTG